MNPSAAHRKTRLAQLFRVYIRESTKKQKSVAYGVCALTKLKKTRILYAQSRIGKRCCPDVFAQKIDGVLLRNQRAGGQAAGNHGGLEKRL